MAVSEFLAEIEGFVVIFGFFAAVLLTMLYRFSGHQKDEERALREIAELRGFYTGAWLVFGLYLARVGIGQITITPSQAIGFVLVMWGIGTALLLVEVIAIWVADVRELLEIDGIREMGVGSTIGGAKWYGGMAALAVLLSYSVPLAALSVFVVLIVESILGPRIIELSHHTRSPSPSDKRRWETLAQRAGLPDIEFRVLQSEVKHNGILAGVRPASQYVYLSSETLETLPEEQIDAIVAHELGHAVESHVEKRMLISASIGGALALVIGYAPLLLVPWIGAVLLYGWHVREQEFIADAAGSDLIDEHTMIESLESMDELTITSMEGTWFLEKVFDHPSVDERVSTLQDDSAPDLLLERILPSRGTSQ